MLRHLFIVGYDISSSRRRRLALKAIKGNAIGGQKSMYECWLTQRELQQVMATLRALIEAETDRVVFVRLDPRAAIHTLGAGVLPADGDHFYAG
jgi:CRISPR-associated protein Cas2